MAEKMRLHEAFAKFGTKSRNRRTAWAARSEDQKTVAVTVWKEDYNYNGGNPQCVYDGATPDRTGWKERTEYIKHAIRECNGLVRVILIEAKKARKPGQPREFKQVLRIFEDQWFQVRDFDPDSGHCTLEMILGNEKREIVTIKQD